MPRDQEESMTYPIPIDALEEDRLFFGGTAGAGKSYNAMGAAERLLHRSFRVVIPDPLSVWWGLRLLADGKTPSGFDVVIFGGPHGDLPLTEHAGALIGETVAGMKESCILDLSQLGTKASERRFMLAFLTALYRNARGEPLHLVFDEADMWAPQRLLDKDGDAAKLLGMMETVVRRGRIKGFVPWLISQRPAVISKDILSQVDGVVAFKLTGKHDRDAIGSWVEGLADKETWREIERQLPSMERGQGVVWIPGRGLLDTVRFPLKRTFDSSRTPKRGEKLAAAELRPLDLGALKARLATVETQAKANDPKALRAQIAELQRQAAAKVPAPVIDEAALLQARREGFKAGVDATWTFFWHHIADHGDKLRASLDGLTKLSEADKPVMPAALQTGVQHRQAPYSPQPAAPVKNPERGPGSDPNAASFRQPSTAAGGGADALSKGERAILTVLAQRQPERVPAERVAAIAGYARKGGSFRTYMSRLRTAGHIEGGPPPHAITPAGIAALGQFDPLPTGPALLDHWVSHVGKSEGLILRALATRGGHEEARVIAEMLGFALSGGSWRTYVSRLRTLGLVEGSRTLRLHEDLR